MDTMEAFDVVESGDGRWDVQRRDSLSVAGYVWNTGGGFVVWDWADRQIGVFDTMPAAVRALWSLETIG